MHFCSNVWEAILIVEHQLRSYIMHKIWYTGKHRGRVCSGIKQHLVGDYVLVVLIFPQIQILSFDWLSHPIHYDFYRHKTLSILITVMLDLFIAKWLNKRRHIVDDYNCTYKDTFKWYIYEINRNDVTRVETVKQSGPWSVLGIAPDLGQIVLHLWSKFRDILA